MRRFLSIKATPTLEPMEGRTLLSATVGGLHTFQTASGATVVVNREQFQQRGNQITLNLQLSSGGQKFTEVYRMTSKNLSGGAKSTIARDDLINQFVNDAMSHITATSGRGLTSFSDKITSGGVRFTQSVSIRTTSARGLSASSVFDTADAFNVLVQDLVTRTGTQGGTANSGSQQAMSSSLSAGTNSTSSTLLSANPILTTGLASTATGQVTTGNSSGGTIPPFGSSIFTPGSGSGGMLTGNGFPNLGVTPTANGAGFTNIATPTSGAFNGTGTFGGSGSFIGTVTGIIGAVTGTGVSSLNTSTGTGLTSGTTTNGSLTGSGITGVTTPNGSIDGTGTFTGSGNGTGLINNGLGTTIGTIDGTGTLTGAGNGTGLTSGGIGTGLTGTTGSNGTIDGTGTLTGAGNGTGIPFVA